MKKLLLILCSIILISTAVKSQFGVEGYLDFGEHQVSEGFYSKFSNINSFEKNKMGRPGRLPAGACSNTPGMIFLTAFTGVCTGN